MKNNFQCLKCAHEFHTLRYSMSYIEGEEVFKSNGKFIECPECNAKEIEFIRSFNGFCTNFGKFTSSSNEDKKKILKKRSRDHSEKKLKERKHYLDKNFTGKTRDVDFQSNA